MKSYDTPTEFNESFKIGDVKIKFSNLSEISQGGPVIGNLTINGKLMEGYYGGPTIYNDGYLYLPVYVRKFFGTGFKLSRINIVSFTLEYLSTTKDLIFLDKIEKDRIYFFEDMNKTIHKYLPR